jgi:DNA-binding transcriptional LysR family regulator
VKKLRQILTFVKCASAGSISGAARELGISPQAASKHILELEAWLGVKVFHRNTRQFALTAEGAAFLQRCKDGLEQIDEGVRVVRQSTSELAGTVRLAVTPFSLADSVVAPLLAKFQERYPQIALEVIAHNEPPDIVGQAVDVGLMLGAAPSQTAARRVATVPIVLCAAPAYLERYGTPRSVADLKAHRWIALRNTADDNRALPFRFRHGGRVVTEHPPIAFVANDGSTALRAMLDGIGIGQLPHFRVAPHVRTRELVRLDAGHVPPELGLYVYVTGKTRAPHRSQALADYLHEQLSNHPDFLAKPEA